MQILIFSDADCQPASPDWIRWMQGALQQHVEIGLGYSPYTKDNTLLNLFIRFETAYTAIQYFSFALIGMPYMGVGRSSTTLNRSNCNTSRCFCFFRTQKHLEGLLPPEIQTLKYRYQLSVEASDSAWCIGFEPCTSLSDCLFAASRRYICNPNINHRAGENGSSLMDISQNTPKIAGHHFDEVDSPAGRFVCSLLPGIRAGATNR